MQLIVELAEGPDVAKHGGSVSGPCLPAHKVKPK